jgi:hypothetical protein
VVRALAPLYRFKPFCNAWHFFYNGRFARDAQGGKHCSYIRLECQRFNAHLQPIGLVVDRRGHGPWDREYARAHAVMPFPEPCKAVSSLEYLDSTLPVVTTQHLGNHFIEVGDEIRREELLVAAYQVNVEGILFNINEHSAEPRNPPADLGKNVIGSDGFNRGLALSQVLPSSALDGHQNYQP